MVELSTNSTTVGDKDLYGISPSGVVDIALAFERNESTAFIASEFLVAPGVWDAIRPGESPKTKLATLVQAMSADFPAAGFSYWKAPSAMQRAIALLRKDLDGKTTYEKARTIKRALFEEDLPVFSELSVD